MLFLFLLLCCAFDVSSFFFFNDTATTEIYTLSLHDALPISLPCSAHQSSSRRVIARGLAVTRRDRKSTRLNSSHANISYAVFCLKKKKKKNIIHLLLKKKKKKKQQQ